MTISKRIGRGINIVLSSFSVIGQRPVLWAYAFVFILVYNVPFSSFPSFSIPLAFSSYVCLDLFSLENLSSLFNLDLLIKALVSISFNILISLFAIKIFAYLNSRSLSLDESLKALGARIPLIISWTLVSSLMVMLVANGLNLILRQFDFKGTMNAFHIVQLPFALTTYIMMIGAPIVWNIMIFYMIPIIALEKLSLVASLKRAVLLMKKNFVEVFAISCMCIFLATTINPNLWSPILFLIVVSLWAIFMISVIQLYKQS